MVNGLRHVVVGAGIDQRWRSPATTFPVRATMEAPPIPSECHGSLGWRHSRPYPGIMMSIRIDVDSRTRSSTRATASSPSRPRIPRRDPVRAARSWRRIAEVVVDDRTLVPSVTSIPKVENDRYRVFRSGHGVAEPMPASAGRTGSGGTRSRACRPLSVGLAPRAGTRGRWTVNVLPAQGARTVISPPSQASRARLIGQAEARSTVDAAASCRPLGQGLEDPALLIVARCRYRNRRTRWPARTVQFLKGSDVQVPRRTVQVSRHMESARHRPR